MYDTAEKRWRAVQARDRAADTAFIYAVTTTKIYCRPTCPARLARRANVRFFDTTTDAVAASFRPCKRCKPDSATNIHRSTQLVSEAKQYIQRQQGQVTLDQLADHLEISSRYLHHIFSRSVGCTPAAYASRFKTKPKLHHSSNTQTMSALTSTSLSPAVGLNGIGTDHYNMLDTQQSTPYSGLSSGSWSDLENLDIFTSSLMPDDETWHTFDQAPEMLENKPWDDLDFDTMVFQSMPTVDAAIFLNDADQASDYIS